MADDHRTPGLGELFEMGFMRPKFDDPISRVGQFGAVPTSQPFDPRGITAKVNGVPKDPELFHPVGGGVKLSTPFSQLTSTTQPTGPMLLRQPANPEALEGGILVPLYGDKTRAGQTLTHINDEALSDPVRLGGGADFMRENPGSLWASEQGRMKTMSDRVRQIQEDTGKPVFGVHVSMGPEGGDFARMTTRPLLQQARTAPITKASMANFDEAMAGKVKNWPGLSNAMAGDEWLNTAAGRDRATLAKVMALGEFQKQGFPNVAAVRKAITDPDLMHAPMLTTGRTVGKFAEGAPLSRGSHDTYNTNVGGDYVGDLPMTSFNTMFPDFMKTRPPNEQLPITGKSVETKMITQEANAQWLENFMRRLQSGQR